MCMYRGSRISFSKISKLAYQGETGACLNGPLKVAQLSCFKEGSVTYNGQQYNARVVVELKIFN